MIKNNRTRSFNGNPGAPASVSVDCPVAEACTEAGNVTLYLEMNGQAMSTAAVPLPSVRRSAPPFACPFTKCTEPPSYRAVSGGSAACQPPPMAL